jgi:hypothetical protein
MDDVRAAIEPRHGTQALHALDADRRAARAGDRRATMILHRKGDKSVRVEHARFLAEHIAGANSSS